jgi:hypothetical protein
MPTASRPTFLRHFGRSAAARRGPDLADMGTAFALDQSLDQAEHGPEAHAAEPRVIPVASWRLWLGRKLGS